jgi:protein gp37
VAEDSKIEWTTHTFNPWRGCTKVSEGCRSCYAETLSHRNPGTLGVWGPNGTRVVAAEAQWKLPHRWNALAAAAGERHRVFCASLADVFEDWAGPMSAPDGRILVRPYLDAENRPENWQPEYPEVLRTDPQGWKPVTMNDVRDRLFTLIWNTPNLDWLLLTKRPDRMAEWMARPGSQVKGLGGVLRPLHNLWLGVSVENQAAADERIPQLLRTPAAVRFLSCEPLLGPVDLSKWLGEWCECGSGPHPNDTKCQDCGDRTGLHCPHIGWVIAGGESGPGARPMHPEWARSIRDQCQAAEVPFFFKQWGAFLPFPIRDWAKDEQVWLGDVNVYRHGATAKRYEPELQRKLDGKIWGEFPGEVKHG